MSFSAPFPPVLTQATKQHWLSFKAKYESALSTYSSKFLNDLERTFALSDFIADSLLQRADLLDWLYAHKDFKPRQANYAKQLKAYLGDETDEAKLMALLRYFRRQEMLWLAWQDFNQQMTVEEGLNHLSALAEAMISVAYERLYAISTKVYGVPCDLKGNPQQMLILGMGKLGGGELNFSSDIDLIFTYPENGETKGARRSLSNAQFFTRLGQSLIKWLSQKTVDGFCYRIDMRLRPFGESGPLVMSFLALEDYYQEQGRDWERYAMIKAKVIGIFDKKMHEVLYRLLYPFVFRRYIDFSAIQALRRMKGMILREIRRRGAPDNIKLGAGGIREIEFIAQSFQLIRGGREPSLRARELMPTLDAIGKLGLMRLDEIKTLKEAYLFLRRLENLLQAIKDEQTQLLPKDALNQARLAYAMAMPSWEVLDEKIKAEMNKVHTIFDALIGEDKPQNSPDLDLAYVELWEQGRDLAWSAQILADRGFEHAEEYAQSLYQFKIELSKRTIGSRGREVLNRLMPKLLTLLFTSGYSSAKSKTPLPSRVFHLLLCVASRTTYLELLDTHPVAIVQLLRLCRKSQLVAEQLANFPILLDELIDPDALYNPTPFSHYRQALFDYLARIPEEDMEQQMEMIRQFKQTQLLRIAASDIAGALPLMKVSDHLTYLAEAILEAVVNQAWFQMVEKYGAPTHLNEREGRGFAVVGYGKLGGIELAYGSDLDVIFIHDCPDNVMTGGDKAIDGRQFYLRLAQRIVHLFSTRTSSGVLYELDTRLRPSGASGMLATTLDGFLQYQIQDAWVWEHQALVRARVIYGDEIITKGFDKARHQILTQSRSSLELKKAINQMREKMLMQLGTHLTGAGKSSESDKNVFKFHIKLDKGGITDIEFLTQFWVLNFSNAYPKLTKWSDNIRILEQLGTLKLVPSEQVNELIEAYIAFRDMIHRLNLKNAKLIVAEDKFKIPRQKVQKIWRLWIGDEAL